MAAVRELIVTDNDVAAVALVAEMRPAGVAPLAPVPAYTSVPVGAVGGEANDGTTLEQRWNNDGTTTMEQHRWNNVSHGSGNHKCQQQMS